MVKLVYQTIASGPISLEFSQPQITVGCAADCDLVVLHPSVLLRHCTLVLQEQSLIRHPGQDPCQPDSTSASVGREYLVGDRLPVGEVWFEIQHSQLNTIAVPTSVSVGPAQPVEVPMSEEAPTFSCAHCQKSFPEPRIKRIGVVGGTVHLLCPVCTRPVVPDAPPEPVGGDRLGLIERGLAWWKRCRSKAGRC